MLCHEIISLHSKKPDYKYSIIDLAGFVEVSAHLQYLPVT